MNLNDKRSYITQQAHIITRAMRMTDPSLDYRVTFGAAMRELWSVLRDSGAGWCSTSDWYYHCAATRVMQHYESMREAGWAEPRRHGFTVDDRLFASDALLVRLAYAYQAQRRYIDDHEGVDQWIEEAVDCDIFFDPRTHQFGGTAPRVLIDYAASQYAIPGVL